MAAVVRHGGVMLKIGGVTALFCGLCESGGVTARMTVRAGSTESSDQRACFISLPPKNFGSSEAGTGGLNR